MKNILLMMTNRAHIHIHQVLSIFLIDNFVYSNYTYTKKMFLNAREAA